MADEIENEIIDETLGEEGDADVDMGGAEVVEVDTGATVGEHGDEGIVDAPEVEEVTPTRVTFLDWLRSPIVQLVVGQGENSTVLTAHQALLEQSPFFKAAIDEFSDDASVCVTTLLE